MTKQRQAQMLKKQQEKERLKVQTLENIDNVDTESRVRTRRPTTPPYDNGDNIDDTNSPRPQRSKCPILIKLRVQKRIEKCLE